MTKIKPLFFSFFVILLIVIISFNSLCNVNALTSSVTSGLKVVLGVADTNQQNFCYIAGYDIILVKNYIMMYDSNGVLAKSYNLSTANGGYDYQSINRIAVYNSTYLLIGEVHGVYPTFNYITGWFKLLNVNTLSSVTYNFPVNVETSSYSSVDGYGINLAVYVVNGLAFAVGVGSYAGTYGMGVWEMFQNNTVITCASIQNSNSASIPIGRCLLIIPSVDSNSFYLIAETAVNSYLFLIDEINYIINTITLIGIDGLSGGYSGGYIYLLNSQYLTSNTGSNYYEVLISYPDNLANQQLCLNIIRFNNTFVDVHHKLTIGGFNGTFQAPYIRLLGYDFTNNGSGLDGLYNLYYVGLNYLFMQLPISITGTTTNTITYSLLGGIKASTFPQWQIEVYNLQTGNIGGFWNINTGIMVELDYSSTVNSLSCATKFLSVAQGGSTGVGSGNGGTDGSGQGGSWKDSTTTIPTATPINLGGGGGTDTIIPILTSIFGNIVTDIVFIIFGIVCSLLTWKFAMTGLIAGIGISTFLCVIAGLLPIWAVGLCIVLDVTLIILGSGLLNKRGNETGSN